MSSHGEMGILGLTFYLRSTLKLGLAQASLSSIFLQFQFVVILQQAISSSCKIIVQFLSVNVSSFQLRFLTALIFEFTLLGWSMER